MEINEEEDSRSPGVSQFGLGVSGVGFGAGDLEYRVALKGLAKKAEGLAVLKVLNTDEFIPQEAGSPSGYPST